MSNVIEPANVTVDYALGATTVTNTTVETDLGVAMTLPASYFYTGRTLAYRFNVYTSSKASSPGTITFKTYLNSTLIATSGALSLANSESNLGRIGSYDMIVVTGSGGTPLAASTLQVDGAVGATIIPGTTTVATDATANQVLKTTVTFSVADVGNICNATQATVKSFG